MEHPCPVSPAMLLPTAEVSVTLPRPPHVEQTCEDDKGKLVIAVTRHFNTLVSSGWADLRKL